MNCLVVSEGSHAKLDHMWHDIMIHSKCFVCFDHSAFSPLDRIQNLNHCCSTPHLTSWNIHFSQRSHHSPSSKPTWIITHDHLPMSRHTSETPSAPNWSPVLAKKMHLDHRFHQLLGGWGWIGQVRPHISEICLIKHWQRDPHDFYFVWGEQAFVDSMILSQWPMGGIISCKIEILFKRGFHVEKSCASIMFYQLPSLNY